MLINVYKPVGWTSFDVVKKIRGITKEQKVGHAGTLDPFAEGVLIIGTDHDTKKLAALSSQDKSYIATLNLGSETDTLDIEGKRITSKKVPNLSIGDIKKVLSSFLGKQMQIPPMYSAKKINGKRLYQLARKNIEVNRNPIEIEIKDIDLIDYIPPKVIFNINCSKGTYIRVLGSDIAKKLGSVGYLSKLIRTSVGGYPISESIKVDQFEKEWKNISV